MKFFTKDACYVQLKDLSYLLTNGGRFDVLTIAFNKATVINEDNCYKLVKYTDKDHIEYFKNIKYIADYKDFKGLNKEEVLEKGLNAFNKRNDLAKRFNSLSEKDREKNQDLYHQIKEFEYLSEDIKHYAWYVNGHVNMDIPEELNAAKEEVKKDNFIAKVKKLIFKK